MNKDIIEKLHHIQMDSQCDCYICDVAGEAIELINQLTYNLQQERKVSDTLSFLLSVVHPKCNETIVCDICDALADYWSFR